MELWTAVWIVNTITNGFLTLYDKCSNNIVCRIIKRIKLYIRSIDIIDLMNTNVLQWSYDDIKYSNVYTNCNIDTLV